MDLLAWLLRYGPKSIHELLSYPTSFLYELSEAIGRLMEQEKALFEQNLATGDS